MAKKALKDVTLIGVDCVNLDRLVLASEICEKDFEFAEVKLLTSLPQGGHKNTVKINPILSVEQYSEFVIKELDNYFKTSHALVIQYDGFILNPKKWTDEYLNYDYIGAPWLVSDWSVNDFDFPIDLKDTWVVGNGGFSLRSKKLTALCRKLAQENFFSKYHPEDTQICVHNRKKMEEHGIKFAPVDLAKQFSYEAEDENKGLNVWDGQFGFHGLDWTDISKWTSQHPEYQIKNSAAEKKKTAE